MVFFDFERWMLKQIYRAFTRCAQITCKPSSSFRLKLHLFDLLWICRTPCCTTNPRQIESLQQQVVHVKSQACNKSTTSERTTRCPANLQQIAVVEFGSQTSRVVDSYDVSSSATSSAVSHPSDLLRRQLSNLLLTTALAYCWSAQTANLLRRLLIKFYSPHEAEVQKYAIQNIQYVK